MKESAAQNVFVGQTKGVKGVKSHLFGTRWGGVARLCDWLGEDEVERVEGPVTCRHCLGIQQGKRRAAFED